MRSTARNGALSSPKCTDNLSTFNNAISNLLLLQFGIERVTQTVTHQVKCQHRQQDRQTREGHDPPGALRELQHVGEHGAPLRRWRLCPHAEETKSSHIENGVRETERRLNNQRRKAVREDVNKHLTHR